MPSHTSVEAPIFPLSLYIVHSQHFPVLPGRNKSQVDLKPVWDVPENPLSEQWNITRWKILCVALQLAGMNSLLASNLLPTWFTCTNAPAVAPCPSPGDLTSYPSRGSLPTSRIQHSTGMSHPAQCPGQYLHHPLSWPLKFRIPVSHRCKELWKPNPSWVPQWTPWGRSYCFIGGTQAPWKSKLWLGWCWVVWISSYSTLVLEQKPFLFCTTLVLTRDSCRFSSGWKRDRDFELISVGLCH